MIALSACVFHAILAAPSSKLPVPRVPALPEPISGFADELVVSLMSEDEDEVVTDSTGAVSHVKVKPQGTLDGMFGFRSYADRCIRRRDNR